MSELMLNVLDAQRAVHAKAHGSMVDSVIAALSAEPETIEELDQALARFIQPNEERGFFSGWSRGTCQEPWDAGLCVVDLAARLVACRSTWSSPLAAGEVQYHDGTCATDVWICYRLSDDWLLTADIDQWRPLADQRRRQRLANPPLDARPILDGKLAEFVAEACVAARQKWEGPFHTAAGAENPVAEIHARWLMTPRDDLRGQTPRELLLRRRNVIDLDLQYRSFQWSSLQACPPGLPANSAAFRFGGFGTQENVLYYELVRLLVEECWDRLEAASTAGDASAALDVPAEIDRLRSLQEKWLKTPQGDLQGHTPSQAIRRERARLPMGVSGHDASEHGAMVDDDCPLCQMMADSGPMFWHLDGCNMDDDFPFSWDLTREAWEEERRRHAEFDRKFNEEYAARKASEGEQAAASSGSVWRRSFAAEGPEVSAEITLFGIGACLAELGLVLKGTPQADSVTTLNRDFGNLREAARESPDVLLDPVVQRFCDDLDAVAGALPDLAPQCADLQRQLTRFAQRFADRRDEDIPF